MAQVTNLQSMMKHEAPDDSLIMLDTIGLGDTEISQDIVCTTSKIMGDLECKTLMWCDVPKLVYIELTYVEVSVSIVDGSFYRHVIA